MGKGKKERSKKNKNKKETRKPIKRKWEGVKYKNLAHPAGVEAGNVFRRHGTIGKSEDINMDLYEKMFSN